MIGFATEHSHFPSTVSSYEHDRRARHWRKFSCSELVARDKTSLDLFWLKDERLTELAEEIIDNIEAALASIRTVARALEK